MGDLKALTLLIFVLHVFAAEARAEERVFSELFGFEHTERVSGDSCYRVDYSDGHLASQPAQQVEVLFIRFRDDPDATVQGMEIGAKFRRTPYFDGGQTDASVADFERWISTWMPCSDGWSMDGVSICSTGRNSLMDAGGLGVVDIGDDAGSIAIETSAIGAALGEGYWIGNENNCQITGAPCKPVRYRLYRSSLSECSPDK